MSVEQSADQQADPNLQHQPFLKIGQGPDDYQLMVNSVSDYAIILLDETGHVVSWNPGAERFKGYKADEIIGQHFSRFYPAEALESDFPALELRTAIAEGRFEDEGWRVRKDGSMFWANVIITALKDPQGKLRGFAKLTRDLSERKRAEEALREAHDTLEERVAKRTVDLQWANEELRAAKVAADAASHAKSDFLSRMSHELRTPLNAILGFGQLLDMGPPQPDDQESVDHILKAGRHLLSLINEVLDIARVESGRMELSIEPVLVSDVLAEAANLVQALAMHYGIHLDISSVLESEIYAMADQQRLKQVLINLLSNAVKYNRIGGKVDVLCTLADTVRIAVTDTGFGIAPKNLPKLFTPFERLDAIQTTIEGTGLGLAFSKSMVEAMGGVLGMESIEGQGSTFYVELPVATGQMMQAAEHIQTIHHVKDAPTGTFNVLLIEDNFSNYQLIEGILVYRPNVKLTGAMQGSIGLEMARHNHPDLILLDVHLPDILGSEVLRLLRESEDTANIPVIVVSADATPRQIQRLLNAGANAYLTKPLNVKEFLTLLDEALAESLPQK